MFTEQRTNATANRITMTAVALVMAVSVAGCARDRMTTGSISRSTPKAVSNVATMSEPQLRSAADSLGRAYTQNTKDKATALRYASVLQMTGRVDQSLAVMRKLAIDHPKDREVLAAYGKALAAAGELQPALDAVRRA